MARPRFYWRRWASLIAELLAQRLYTRDAAGLYRSLVSALEESHLILALPWLTQGNCPEEASI